MIIPIFVWRSPKGHCYGNQLNLEDARRRHQERFLLFSVAFDIRFADCEATFKRSNDNNSATLRTNLVNFRPIMSEFTLLKRTFCYDSSTILRSSFVMLAFRNKLEDCNFDFRIVISNHFCTFFFINLVMLGSVTSEFMT